MSTAMPPRTSQQITQTVRQQYEHLPYPHRDPSLETTRLHLTSLDDLGALNQYCFKGLKNFSGARFLVAGCGTGDSAVYLAHQLRNIPARIVCIDLSAASLKIAKERVAARKLSHKVDWIHGSLLDLPSMQLEPFDYINCSGVLHHLPDPVQGLASLKQVLKPDGALGIMVYGQYGRTGVYQLQDLMRIITVHEADENNRLDLTKTLLRSLPDTNWYHRAQEIFEPILEMSDAETYDLFLHSQDRAYTVPQLYEWLATAQLTIAEYAMDSRAWYRPDIAFMQEPMASTVAQLPVPLQQAACELFWGSISKHSFWATAHSDTVARWDNEDYIPSWSHFGQLTDIRGNVLKSTDENWTLDVQKGDKGSRLELKIKNTPLHRAFIEQINGQRTIGDLCFGIASQFQLPPNEVAAQLGYVFNLFNLTDMLVLRHKSVPAAEY